MNRFNSNFTVEETNLLSIYMTGSKEGLVVAMNAALPFMEGEMRDFAARTLEKVVCPADEVGARSSGSRRPKAGKSTPLCAGRAATAITATVSCWTTGTIAYARSSFPIPCSVNGSVLRYCPPIRSCTPSFTTRRICAVVAYAVRPLRPAPTGLFTARTAGNVSPADGPPSA